MCYLLGQLQDVTLSTHTNPSDVLLLEVASHSYYYKVYLCYCLLFTEGYIVADTYLSRLQCLNVVLSKSTHQCQINTTPSQIEVLVPKFQEPPTADLLSELIASMKCMFNFMQQRVALGGH